MRQYLGKTKTGGLQIPFRNVFCEALYEMEQRDKNSRGAVVSLVEGATGLGSLSLFSFGGLRSLCSVCLCFVSFILTTLQQSPHVWFIYILCYCRLYMSSWERGTG